MKAATDAELLANLRAKRSFAASQKGAIRLAMMKSVRALESEARERGL